jgi:hypothetical protein
MASILHSTDFTNLKLAFPSLDETDEKLGQFVGKVQSLLKLAGVSPFFDELVTITEQVVPILDRFVTQFPINSITSVISDCDSSNTNLWIENCKILKYDNLFKLNATCYTTQYCNSDFGCQDNPQSYTVTYKTGYSIDQDTALEQIVKTLYSQFKPYFWSDNCEQDNDYDPTLRSKSADNTTLSYFDPEMVERIKQDNIAKQLKAIEPFVKMITPKPHSTLTIA